MNKYKTLFLLAAFLGMHTAHAATFAISFSDGDFDDTAGTSGIFWNGVTGSSPSDVDLTATDGSTATGISLTTTNDGGFTSGNRGSNDPITENGITFPGDVNDGYVADNTASGRDGLMVFRFTAPKTSEFQVWEFTVTGSYDNAETGDGVHLVKYNVGGTYSSKDFTGGTTLTLDANLGTSNLDAGFFSANATDAGSNYIIDFQVGYAGSGTSSVGAINALHVETSAIPEPGTLALLGLALGALVLFRRRR